METKLGILEAKVMAAVGLIKELRAENESLKKRCVELQSAAADADETIRRLNNELEQARQEVVRADEYEEKRKEIETKVGGLLEKLEALG